MSALVFILVLSVLIVVHEFGHFVMAKATGVRVEKFSIGFGPVVFGRRFGQTDFVVSLLPLGGFVKLAGENPVEAEGFAWEFNSKSLWQKFAIVFAGPFMNAFLAFILFVAVFRAGEPILTTRVGRVLENSPAQAAGILPGDRIVAVNGQTIWRWDELLNEIHKGQEEVALSIEREGRTSIFAVEPKKEALPDKMGRRTRVNFIGIAPAGEMQYERHSLWDSLRMGFERVWMLTMMILYSLGLMITGALPFKESVTGPIGIFFMTQEAARLGFIYLFLFMANLSVSLFVLNLLPIPVLDGGHVLFILIERLKGSPLKESVKERMTQGGLVILLAFMGLVILQDIHRFSIFENLKNLILGISGK